MITSVELGNFLSHKKSEINFDNGVTVFIGENGSGKSSVIDGITSVSYTHLTLPTNREV